MKRNVVLFSLLGVGVLYLLYSEKEHTPSKKEHIESTTDTTNDSETPLYHTRKLLSFGNPRNKLIKTDYVKNTLETSLGDSKSGILGMETLQSLGSRRKFIRRRKRDVPYPEQEYDWKFTLNVSRRENNGSPNKLPYPVLNDGNPEDGHLGMAMTVSGNGPTQSVGDLYKAWESVGQFLRTLFGGNLKELQDRGHDVSLDISSLPNGTLEVPPDSFLEGSGAEDSQELKNRRGKFLAGLFNFGGNKENPPRDEGSGEIDFKEISITESEFRELNSSETLSKVETGSVLAATTTENLTEHVTTPSSLLGEISTVTGTGRNTTPANSNVEEPFSDVNCTNCQLQIKPAVSTDVEVPDEQGPTAQPFVFTTIPTEIPLSDETLKNFCGALLSRMRTSGRSVEESEGSGNIESLVSDSTASNALTDNPGSQNLGFFESLWNRIVGRRNAANKEEPSKDSRSARLIRLGNIFGGFGGSGRSVDLVETDYVDLKEFSDDLNNIEDGDKFILHCEEFIKSAHTDTRPNIFDLVDLNQIETFTTEVTTQDTDPFQIDEHDIEDLNKKIASHFESTTQKEIFTLLSTISETNIEEQTSRNFMDQFTTEQKMRQFEEKEETSVSSATEMAFTEAQKKVETDPLSILNLVMENVSATQEFKPTETSDKFMLTAIPEIGLTTKESNINLDEERSLNLFGFGSGADEGSSDISNINERIFPGLLNFGSGEREIKETEILTTEDGLDQTTENRQQRSFGLFNFFGSGERKIEEETMLIENKSTGGSVVPFSIDLGSGARELDNTDKEDIFTSTIINEGRSFGFLGFGSGERDLPETSNFATENELLSFPTTKESIATERPLLTSEFPVEISEQRIPLSTDIPIDEGKNERSFELNIFGSGGGRELPDIENINCLDCLSEPYRSECAACGNILNYTDAVATLDTSTVGVIEEIVLEKKCPDCKATDLPPIQDSTIEVSLGGGMYYTDPSYGNEVKTPSNGYEVIYNVANHSFPPKQEDTKTSTEITMESTTLLEKSRLFNTIFLTGSGEGGLFVDDKGPINLVQESDNTPPPVVQPPIQPRRGARKHDSLDFQIPNERIKVTQFMPVQTTEGNDLTDYQSTKDVSTSYPFVPDADNETEIDEGLQGTDASTPTFESESPELPIFSISSTTPKTTSTIDTTTSMVVSTSPKIKPRSKFIEPPQRTCKSASQCNRTLNERCISEGRISICKCGRSYVRSPETGKCEAPVMLTTSLKLPGEVYHEDLKNKDSERFRKMANDSIETMWILLGDDPDIFRLVAGVDVSGFEKGSLVVHWEITLAAPPNESVAALIQQVDAELKEAFEDEDLLKRAPLNVQDAVLVSLTNDINPCEKAELNYCSLDANCIRDPERGFKCECKEDFDDRSTDKNHPGENCTAKCPSYYCGDHGDCKLKKTGEIHCSCNSWYFGEKCEISGIVVIAGFASFNVLLIIVVLLLVCYCRKRRYRQSQFYGQNQVRFQPESELGRFTASPRLADAIALNDVGPTKASKYMSVSTPMHRTPDIRLTSPSILGSSVDYDYDSTFDRTPSVGEVSVEVHKSKSSPKV